MWAGFTKCTQRNPTTLKTDWDTKRFDHTFRKRNEWSWIKAKWCLKDAERWT